MVQQHPHREVNKQPHDIIQGGDEWTGSQGRIDLVVVQDQRNQGPEDRGENNYSKQGDTNHHAQRGIFKVTRNAENQRS